VPEPYLDFDSRVHRVSVDEALERLIQLTKQSGNARKDLLKIQESALAIRLRNLAGVKSKTTMYRAKIGEDEKRKRREGPEKAKTGNLTRRRKGKEPTDVRAGKGRRLK